MVVRPEIGERHVLAEVDAAEEAEAGAGRDLVESIGDELDLLVVGRHAQTHQPVRRRQPVEHVDLDGHAWIAKQVVGDVEPGRSGADDRDTQRPRRRPGGRRQCASPLSPARSCVCSVSTSPW